MIQRRYAIAARLMAFIAAALIAACGGGSAATSGGTPPATSTTGAWNQSTWDHSTFGN